MAITDRRSLGPVLLALLACLSPACGGGGGGGNDQPATPTRCIGYSSGSPSAGEVAGRQGAGGACGMLALEIVVAGVNDVFAADFKISFNPAVMTFDSVSDAGSFLKSGGVTTAAQGSPSGGTATIGITRLNTASGVNFPASGELLMTVFFRRATNSATTAPVGFTDTNLRDPQTPPQPIAGITWINGTATIQ